MRNKYIYKVYQDEAFEDPFAYGYYLTIELAEEAKAQILKEHRQEWEEEIKQYVSNEQFNKIRTYIEIDIEIDEILAKGEL